MKVIQLWWGVEVYHMSEQQWLFKTFAHDARVLCVLLLFFRVGMPKLSCLLLLMYTPYDCSHLWLVSWFGFVSCWRLCALQHSFWQTFLRERLADQSDGSPVLQTLLYALFFLLERHLIWTLIQRALRCFLEETMLAIRSRHSEQIDLKTDHNTSTGVSDEKFVKILKSTATWYDLFGDNLSCSIEISVWLFQELLLHQVEFQHVLFHGHLYQGLFCNWKWKTVYLWQRCIVCCYFWLGSQKIDRIHE